MSRVRLTGSYRYSIYVTPDYAIVEGLDLGTGQEAMRISRHSGSLISLLDPLVLAQKGKKKYSIGDSQQQQQRNNRELKKRQQCLCLSTTCCDAFIAVVKNVGVSGLSRRARR